MPHILVVEGEYLLADDLRTTLEEDGITVVGPVSNEHDALALLQDVPIDGAVLDINLNGRMVYPLARRLNSRGIPFLFLTGYDNAEPAEDFADTEVLRKPFTHSNLRAAIRRLEK